MRDRDHGGILEKVVVTAIEVPFPVGVGGLERSAVHGLHVAVFIGHLRALDLEGKTLADTADDIIQQLGVLVDILGNEVVQVIGCLVFHLVQVLVPPDGMDGTDGGQFTAPDTGDGDHQRGKDADNPKQDFFHNGYSLFRTTIKDNYFYWIGISSFTVKLRPML